MKIRIELQHGDETHAIESAYADVYRSDADEAFEAITKRAIDGLRAVFTGIPGPASTEENSK